MSTVMHPCRIAVAVVFVAAACGTDPGDAPGADASSTLDSPPSTIDAPIDRADAYTQPPGDPVWLGVGSWGWRGRTGDGVTWVDVQNDPPPDMDDHTDDLLRGVGFGGGRFVAVGGAQVAMVMVSNDGGATWDDTIHGDLGWLGDVVYADGTWVAGGANGTRATSADGDDWQSTGDWYEGHWRSLAYGNGRVVAVGNAYTGGAISAVSTDRGATWTEHDVGGIAFSQVAFGDGRFVAVSLERCAVSTDGAAWADCGLTVERFGGVSAVDGHIVVSYAKAPWPAGGYATFDGAGQLVEHAVDRFPDNVAHAGGVYVGVDSNRRVYGAAFDQWTQADDAGGFRDFTLGFVD